MSTVDTASSRADGGSGPGVALPDVAGGVVSRVPTPRQAAAPSPLRYPPPLEKVTG
ncbi:hypothetical protein [Actinoalloteichus sp. GBA129-24]|uniref:hypothetical protein n=1 Tax=Actinoalloteichus sp. GBA129-24 TaxID=1612551 RepID=UPI0012F8528F|nr:hypothetical protein [Actinoalloteichus sp. GBA129-24]